MPLLFAVLFLATLVSSDSSGSPVAFWCVQSENELAEEELVHSGELSNKVFLLPGNVRAGYRVHRVPI